MNITYQSYGFCKYPHFPAIVILCEDFLYPTEKQRLTSNETFVKIIFLCWIECIATFAHCIP